MWSMDLVHIDALALEVPLRHLNLRHQALVGIGYIVEGKYPPAKLEQEVRSE